MELKILINLFFVNNLHNFPVKNKLFEFFEIKNKIIYDTITFNFTFFQWHRDKYTIQMKYSRGNCSQATSPAGGGRFLINIANIDIILKKFLGYFFGTSFTNSSELLMQLLVSNIFAANYFTIVPSAKYISCCVSNL